MEQYIEQLKPLFDKVAEKIGQGAEFGWEVVVRQQYVEGVAHLVNSFIVFLVFFAGGYLFYRLRKSIIEHTQGVAFMLALVLIPLFLLGWNELIEGIKHLLNPSFYALDFFIQLVK